MSNQNQIRPVVRDDVPAIKAVVDATLFPADMLDHMIAPYFEADICTDIWLTHEVGGRAVAVAFCEAERMTQGTWNLLAIGVLPSHQGQGTGTRLIKHLERVLSQRDGRILIVETSGLPEYTQTRRFYRQRGYVEEARIREFYAEGEDKIVYWKSLKTGS